MRTLVLALALAGCGILSPNYLDAPDRRPLERIPDRYYRTWHAEVESCLGRSRPFDDVLWFIADEVFLGGVAKGGVFHRPNEITMRNDHVLSERAVKHELIHYVRQESRHGPVYDRCAPSPPPPATSAD